MKSYLVDPDFGTHGPRLVEHPQTVKRVYSIEWKRPDLDLTELAKFRWVHEWSIPRLCRHFARKKDTIQMHICQMRKSGIWRDFDLSKDERASIKINIKRVYRGSGGRSD